MDDQPGFAEGVARSLRSYGHRAHAFEEPEQALRSLERVKPDVILSDLEMPGIDGCEFARRVRARAGDVPLVAVTGYGDAEYTARVIDAGFAYRLVKPVDPHDMAALLEEIAAHRSEALGGQSGAMG